MAEYRYTAVNPQTGQKAAGKLKADTEQAVMQMLSSQGLIPLDIKGNNRAGLLDRLTNRISTKEKVIFSRQLSTLINAGLPLVQSLKNIQNQIQNKTFKDIISKIIVQVEGGNAFADALSKFPEVFDPLYVNMVAAGEGSGTLDVSLQRIADQQEKDAEIISKVRGALVYPIIVLLAISAVVVFMITTVLPQVKSLYEELPGAHLPIFTRILFSVSNILSHWWWMVAILVIGGIVFARFWSKTPAGRAFFDELKIKLPVVGQLYMRVYMARFARVGSTLMKSGVPMIQMLNTTANAIGNVRVSHSIDVAAEKVKGGKSLADSLQGDPNLLPLVPDMIRIGEQSGALENMLEKVAEYYEKEVDNQIRGISSIIEPALMIIIGGIALFIVASVLLPIYSLVGQNLIQ